MTNALALDHAYLGEYNRIMRQRWLDSLSEARKNEMPSLIELCDRVLDGFDRTTFWPP